MKILAELFPGLYVEVTETHPDWERFRLSADINGIVSHHILADYHYLSAIAENILSQKIAARRAGQPFGRMLETKEL